METIASFDRPEDAYLFRSFLESEGISSYVFDEYTSQWIWYYTSAIGGVRVMVAGEDAERARELRRGYAESLANAPLMEPVRGWPLVALLSLLCSPLPMIIFGRKAAKPDESETQNP